jgi:chorismate mutase
VDGALARCVRVLMHVYLPAGHASRHVYLHDARQLRLDLPE